MIPGGGSVPIAKQLCLDVLTELPMRRCADGELQTCVRSVTAEGGDYQPGLGRKHKCSRLHYIKDCKSCDRKENAISID